MNNMNTRDDSQRLHTLVSCARCPRGYRIRDMLDTPVGRLCPECATEAIGIMWQYIDAHNEEPWARHCIERLNNAGKGVGE